MRWLLLICLALLLAGCGYSSEVKRRETDWGVVKASDSERFGQLRVVLVEEYREPRGLSRFPDGGVTLEVAHYFVVYQSDSKEEHPVGRIDIAPVRRGDFGNMYTSKFEWVAPDQLAYRGEYGYTGNLRRVYEGSLTIPPLPR